ncbi:MAG: site-specific integrase [Bacteroidota bacterium]
MTNATTFSLFFRIRKKASQPDFSTIQARLKVGNDRVDFSLNRPVRTEIWDNVNRRAKGSSAEAKKLNLFLDEVRMNIFGAYDQLRREKKIITAESVKARYFNEDSSELTLISAFEYHNEEVAHTLAPGTARHYNTCLAHVKRFMKKVLKAEDIYLDELSYSFITRFELFLRKYKPVDHQKPLGNNTIMKHIQRVRKVVSLAVKLEWIDKDPFAKYQCKFVPTSRKYLSDEELARFEKLEGLGDRLQYVKDLFIFSCYSGLVYIDTMNLTSNNIVIGIDGNKWIYTDRQKSRKSVRIPLLPKAEEMIDKYKMDPRSVYAGTLFPKISNQRLNSYLKELASLAGIESKLTFHVARHTFATTIALMNGLPIETLSKILGHSKITTTQMYAKVLNQKVSTDMGNLKLIMIQKDKISKNEKVSKLSS